MAVTTVPIDLSPEDKATRDLSAGLLDARRNLATLGRDAETAIRKKKEAALREIGKATTVDQLISLAKTAVATIELLEKDSVSIQTSEKLVKKSLEQLETESAPVHLAVLMERSDRIKLELSRSADSNKPLNEELERLSKEISALSGRRKSTS